MSDPRVARGREALEALRAGVIGLEAVKRAREVLVALTVPYEDAIAEAFGTSVSALTDEQRIEFVAREQAAQAPDPSHLDGTAPLHLRRCPARRVRGVVLAAFRLYQVAEEGSVSLRMARREGIPLDLIDCTLVQQAQGTYDPVPRWQWSRREG